MKKLKACFMHTYFTLITNTKKTNIPNQDKLKFCITNLNVI